MKIEQYIEDRIQQLEKVLANTQSEYAKLRIMAQIYELQEALLWMLRQQFGELDGQYTPHKTLINSDPGDEIVGHEL